jgi:hypothetical protein
MFSCFRFSLRPSFLPFCFRFAPVAYPVSFRLQYKIAPRAFAGRKANAQAITGTVTSLPHIACIVHSALIRRTDSEPRVQMPQDPCVLIFHLFKVVISFLSMERLAPYPPPYFSRLQERFVSSRCPAAFARSRGAERISFSESRTNAVLLRVRELGRPLSPVVGPSTSLLHRARSSNVGAQPRFYLILKHHFELTPRLTV